MKVNRKYKAIVFLTVMTVLFREEDA